MYPLRVFGSAIVMLGLFLVLQLQVPAQLEKPCSYLPLCPQTYWNFDIGTIEVGDEEDVNGLIGRNIKYPDGTKEVYRCDETGVYILRVLFLDDDCITITVTFDDPLLLMPPNAVVGETRPLSSGIVVSCMTVNEIFMGSASGIIRLDEFYRSYIVTAGQFVNVAQVTLTASLTAAGETIPMDQTTWFAQNVGPIKQEDRVWEESGQLVDGQVCGAAITPKTMNLAPYTPFGWDDALVISHSQGTSVSDTQFEQDRPLFVDFAGHNAGPETIERSFFFGLLVDGLFVSQVRVAPPVPQGGYFVMYDWQVPALDPGSHTITARYDTTSVIAEWDEEDNDYSRVIDIAARNAVEDWTLYQ